MFEDLSPGCKQWLVTEVRSTLQALQASSPHGAWLRKHLDNLLWYWSVDLMENGAVLRDAIPQNGGDGSIFSSQWHARGTPHWHTRLARGAHQGAPSNLIKRDHLVPKKVLCDELLPFARTAKEVEDMLERYNFVVLIHADEDRRLNQAGLRQRMPRGWDTHPPLARDPWARYPGGAPGGADLRLRVRSEQLGRRDV